MKIKKENNEKRKCEEGRVNKEEGRMDKNRKNETMVKNVKKFNN